MFAESQCGDAERADEAIAEAMRGFCMVSADAPLSAWPAAFWAALIVQPGLREYAQTRGVPEAGARLAVLTPGPRAALLLRLVAGLSLPHAAAVLGVSEPAYRHALARALEALRVGDDDGAGLRALRDALHRRVKTLPPEQLATLATRRERALRGETAPASKPAPRTVRPAWLPPALWSAFAALALGFVATFFIGRFGATLRPGDMQPLPAGSPPSAIMAPEASLLADPDFELHADPQGAQLSQRLDFFAWYAGEGEQAAAAPAEPAEEDGENAR